MKRHLFMLFLLKLFLIGGSLSLHAQNEWQNLLEEISQSEDFESTNWEDYEEELEELAQHPINLNTATREDLEQLPFLTPSQVEDIEYYLHRYGPMKSQGEIAMIPSISWYQRQLLGYFVYAGEVKAKGFPRLDNITRYGKHEAVGMVKIPFYERKGDVSSDGYMGYEYKHSVRYLFRYGDYVKAGFLGAQDAGEPFGAGKNNLGYDFYSFYLQVRKLGKWKNITIGRYRLHEGMGLILNNDFSLGKLSLLSSLGRNSNSIKVHSSRSSANYLQGIAATYSLGKHLDLTAFASYRKIDATLSKEGGIKTILKTGLHRTMNEIERQNVASNTLVGGNLNYRQNGWHIGATAFYTSFSLPLMPSNTSLYKRFAPQGYQFWNASVDYGYTSHRWNIAGETATGDCGAIATLNSVSYLFSEHFALTALHRFYSARYYSLFSNAFAEGSEVQDENGVYLGVTWAPIHRLSITAYSDFAFFVWPKYHTKESTQSWDNLLSVVYQTSHTWTIGGRLRYKDKAGTVSERLRLYVNAVQSHWNAKATFDYTVVKEGSLMGEEEDYSSAGYMLGENMGWHGKRWTVSGSFGYFHTQDYDSRIYTYEPGLLYQMNFGSYFGDGIRYAVVIRSEIGKHLLLVAKWGTTDYFDRNHISSGLQEISHSSQTDMELQIKWKL